MQLHPIPYKVGSFVMGSNFNGDKWFEIDLKGLPHHVQFGVGHVTEFELALNGQISTEDGSAKIKSSDLHYFLDWELIGPEGFRMASRKGWHDPVRMALDYGYIPGTRAVDVAANSSGNPVLTTVEFSKHMGFIEEQMGPQSAYARCMPSIAYAKTNSKIRIFAHATNEEIRPATASATAKWDSLTVDVYAHILDLPGERTNIPVLVEEGAAEGKTELTPTPGNGAYLRTVLANSPAMDTDEDELAAYTKVNFFGTTGNYARYEEDVAQMLRAYHAEVTDAVEPHRSTDAIGTNQKLEFRFLDDKENTDGVRRGIPLIYPRGGQDFADMRRWYGNEPTLRTNDGSRTSLPASVDFLFDRIEARQPKHVAAILNALGARARTQRPQIPGFYRGRQKLDASRIALTVDGRE